ncbi:phytochromobilin:ferredoxin oxidoreductase, chloroplastic [Cannabis sativa]|uniref:phytochromobilin:ferredoxin oxidoreductase, chloroplastic n=1 Tax=Cannabis sativa TaxID=3483 RepID=UPI0029CA44F0|nr:phytochromobilin:ferredoxin oxidoreductase, chloroplastic [Cannabis sativa]
MSVSEKLLSSSMKSSSSSSSSFLSFFPPETPRLRLSSSVLHSSVSYSWKQKRPSFQVYAVSYEKFIQFALNHTKHHTHLSPSPLQEKFSSMMSTDGNVELQMGSFEAPKIRLLRSLSIETETMQVLDFAAFPKPEYDVPIFCANFFSNASTSIVLLDLNPLHDVINQREYKEKYYSSLIPLGVKYSELLPWGGKLTSESLTFFSPIVIWTRFTPNQHKYDVLYSAFVDYYKAWVELIDEAAEENDASIIKFNCEAQHRYLAWRAEKDPGHGLLKRLIGDTAAKELLRNFLFHGIDELGSKSFLDYFPDYRSEDGTVIEKRSIIGKSFENRPWDARGEFVGNIFIN